MTVMKMVAMKAAMKVARLVVQTGNVLAERMDYCLVVKMVDWMEGDSAAPLVIEKVVQLAGKMVVQSERKSVELLVEMLAGH